MSSIALQCVLYMYYLYKQAHVSSCFVLICLSSTIISFVQFECKLTNLSAPNGSEITEEMVQKENTIQRMVPLHISFSIKSCLPLLANTVRFLGIVSYVQLHLFTLHFKVTTYINFFPLSNWYVSLKIMRIFWIEMKWIIIFPLKAMKKASHLMTFYLATEFSGMNKGH